MPMVAARAGPTGRTALGIGHGARALALAFGGIVEPAQAFRLGRHLGVQFHPEATARSVARWVAPHDGHTDPRLLLTAIDRDANAAARCAQRLFSTFVDVV